MALSGRRGQLREQLTFALALAACRATDLLLRRTARHTRRPLGFGGSLGTLLFPCGSHRSSYRLYQRKYAVSGRIADLALDG